MHIEPGIVEGTKIVLSYATAVGVFGYTAKLAMQCDPTGWRHSARTSQSDRGLPCILFLRGVSALSDRRFRSSPDSGVDALSHVWRRASGHWSGGWIADARALLHPMGLASVRHECHDAPGTPVCAQCHGTSLHPGEHGVQGCQIQPVPGAVDRLPGRRGGLGCLLGDLRSGRGCSQSGAHRDILVSPT